MSQNRKKFDQVIRPGDNGGLRPAPIPLPINTQQQQQMAGPTHEEIMAMDNAECPACHGRLFSVGCWLKKFPSVHPKNIKSRSVLIPATLHYCLNCGKEMGPGECKAVFK